MTRAFDADWRGQFSLKPFLPPDTLHGYTFSFWARASSEGADTTASTNMPKVPCPRVRVRAGAWGWGQGQG